jgi:hypothetical protein
MPVLELAIVSKNEGHLLSIEDHNGRAEAQKAGKKK